MLEYLFIIYVGEISYRITNIWGPIVRIVYRALGLPIRLFNIKDKPKE